MAEDPVYHVSLCKKHSEGTPNKETKKDGLLIYALLDARLW